MEYLAKKSPFSFLQDFAVTSINNETYTNKGRTIRKVMRGEGFLACQNFFFGPFPVQ